MSNQNKQGNSSGRVNPVALVAGVGLGALAAVGGYLFGRYQESCEAAEKSKSTPPPPRGPTNTYSQRQVQEDLSPDIEKPVRDRECVICFREFEDLMKNDDEIHTTPCGHVFCFNCIHKALVEKRRCPICREEVDPEHTLRIFL